MALVSILIPCYNAAPYLADTIESVQSQTFQDWELLIIDDCSTDNSYDIAQFYSQSNSKIRLIRNEENLGMIGNWNKGISLCSSPLFVKLDADDLWDSTMLSKSINILEKNRHIGLVFTRFTTIDASGKTVEGMDIPLPAFARNKAFSCIDLVKQGPEKMLSYPILRQGLSVMRREVFDKIGGYRYLLSKETQASSDVEFYFRVGASYQIHCIDEALYYYRVHEESISAVDSRNFLTDKKLFEIKYSIIKYYIEQQILTQAEGKKFQAAIVRTYNFSRIANYRKAGDIKNASKVFFSQLFQSPVATFFFYLKRMKEKLHYHG
jgi:glycosyltransferase involved in cell wall biosynthesis